MIYYRHNNCDIKQKEQISDKGYTSLHNIHYCLKHTLSNNPFQSVAVKQLLEPRETVKTYLLHNYLSYIVGRVAEYGCGEKTYMN